MNYTFSFLFSIFHFSSLITFCLGIYRPDLYDDFISKRDACDWNPVNEDDEKPNIHDRGFKDIYECIIDGIEFEEGRGFSRVVRFGPFTTTAGESVFSTFRKPKIPTSAWHKGFVGHIIDPHTERPIEFPPLHLHHMISKNSINPTMHALRDDILYMDEGHRAGSYPRIASDFECSAEDGGVSCDFFFQRPGYAEWMEKGDAGQFVVEFDDVRVGGNSLPLTFYVEYMDMFLTSLHASTPAMKRTHDIQFVLSNDLYKMQTDISVYNFDTYYIPTDMELEDVRVHGHWAVGDEIWVVKGTQEDLGIETSHRKPVISTYSATLMLSLPKEVPENDLPNLQRNLKANVLKAALRYENNKHKSRVKSSFKQHGYEHGVFKAYNESNKPPSRPEILCKFRGNPEEYTTKKITEKNKLFQAQFVADEQKINNHAAARKSWFGDVITRVNWTTPEQQKEGMFADIMEGMYNRISIPSSTNPFEAEHSQCESMHFKAGDHLTLIGFNVARGLKGPLQQHTVLFGHAHMPKFDQVYMAEDIVKQRNLMAQPQQQTKTKIKRGASKHLRVRRRVAARHT